jgi:hypothetical protein
LKQRIVNQTDSFYLPLLWKKHKMNWEFTKEEKVKRSIVYSIIRN